MEQPNWSRHRSRQRYQDFGRLETTRFIASEYYHGEFGGWYSYYTDLGSHLIEVEDFYDMHPSNGKKEVNPCLHTKLTRSWNMSRCIDGHSGSTYDLVSPAIFVDSFSLNGLPEVEPSELYDGFMDRLHEKLMQSSPDRVVESSLMFIKDIHGTIEMMRNPLSFLVDFVNIAGKRRHKGETLARVLATEAPKSWANGYLTYRFGWRQLYRDIYDTMSAMYDVRDRYAQYLASREKAVRVRVTNTSTSSVSNHPKPTSSDHGYLSLTDSQFSLTGFLDAEIRPGGQTKSYAEFIQHSLGLEPAQLLPLAWDAIPYSFVVDWFIPVGETLGNIAETPCDITLRQECYTLHQRTTMQYVHYIDRGDWSGPHGRPANSPSGLRQTYFTDVYDRFQRSKTIPNQDGSWYNTTRGLEALALMLQRLKFPISKGSKK